MCCRVAGLELNTKESTLYVTNSAFKHKHIKQVKNGSGDKNKCAGMNLALYLPNREAFSVHSKSGEPKDYK